MSEWPTEPAVFHSRCRDLESLLDLDAVEQLIADHGLRVPGAVMARNTRVLDQRAFTVSLKGGSAGAYELVDGAAVGDRLREGNTLILRGLETSWAPLRLFCRRLTAELGHYVHANAYLTPPGSQGFGHHFDTHSAFIAQTVGSKRWEIFAPDIEDPLAVHQRATEPLESEEVRRIVGKGAFMSVRLRAGDVLWLPRGWIHNGFAEEGHSLHVTMGINQLTHHWVLEQLLRMATDDPQLRASLPPGLNGIDLDGTVQEALARLTTWYSNTSHPSAVQRIRNEQLRLQRGPRRQSVAAGLGCLDTDGIDQVVFVPGAVLRMDQVADGVLLHLGDRAVPLRDIEGEIVASAVASGAKLLIGDVEEALGSDRAAALIRVLLSEGIAEPVDKTHNVDQFRADTEGATG